MELILVRNFINLIYVWLNMMESWFLVMLYEKNAIFINKVCYEFTICLFSSQKTFITSVTTLTWRKIKILNLLIYMKTNNISNNKNFKCYSINKI